MPIFFQQDMDEGTRLAVWKIEEAEGFFQVPLQREITHPHKRLQHLAGRYLLKYLFPAFPLELIRIADTRKPFLEDEAFHFSVSHCGDFAAVIVSDKKRVGVDAELVSEKVQRIQHKFLSEEEQSLAGIPEPLVRFHTLAWSCKEAVFKWYGKGGVDFREHMVLRSVSGTRENHFDTIVQFKKEGALFLPLQSVFFGGLCLSYVAT